MIGGGDSLNIEIIIYKAVYAKLKSEHVNFEKDVSSFLPELRTRRRLPWRLKSQKKYKARTQAHFPNNSAIKSEAKKLGKKQGNHTVQQRDFFLLFAWRAMMTKPNSGVLVKFENSL